MEYYMSTKSVKYMCIYLHNTHIMIQLVKTLLKIQIYGIGLCKIVYVCVPACGECEFMHRNES